MSDADEANVAEHASAAETAQLLPEKPLDPSLICFVLLAKFLGTPADPARMIHDRGRGEEPRGVEDFARISKRLGLIAKIRTSKLDELPKLPRSRTRRMPVGTNVILPKIEDASLTPRYLVQRGDSERPEI